MWFNPADTLSKQRLFNFLIGARGTGKTTGCIKYGIERRLKKDPTFEIGWVRRFDTERKAIKSSFFDTIKSKEWFENEFKVSGNVGYIDKTPFIHFLALTKDTRTKGVTSPNIRLIVFDEFLIDKGSYYLTDEVNRFLSLYDTIARPSDPSRPRVPVLFLANAMTLTNPYFLYFNVKFNPNGVFRAKNIYAEILKDAEFEEHAKSTEFAELIKGTAYAQHSIDNQFLLDNYDFVEKKSPTAKHMCALRYGGKTYGVWVDWDNGKVWLSQKFDPSTYQYYVVTADDLQANALTAKYFKRSYSYSVIQTAFNSGAMYFETIDLKNIWYRILRILNI